MKQHRERDGIFYRLTLIAILAVGFFSATAASYDRQLQLMIILMTSMFYVGWGIFHHYAQHDVTAKIVVEYIAIGTLGISVIFFVLRSAGL